MLILFLKSSADECSQLNVEDDIIFIDSQIVVNKIK